MPGPSVFASARLWGGPVASWRVERVESSPIAQAATAELKPKFVAASESEAAEARLGLTALSFVAVDCDILGNAGLCGRMNIKSTPALVHLAARWGVR